MPARAALIVPVYDEAERLDVAALAALARARPSLTLWLVDDGSTDETPAVLERLRAGDPERIRVITLPRNGGKGEAVRAGLRAALEDGAALVGYLDADLSTPPAEALALLDVAAESSAVAVLGSRVRLLGRTIERRPHRHYLGRVFATLASLALGLPVYDTQCGAKVFRAGPALARALATPFRGRWIFDVELLARLCAGGDGVAPLGATDLLEVPLRTWRDVAGSRLRPGAMIAAGAQIVALAVRLRVGKAPAPAAPAPAAPSRARGLAAAAALAALAAATFGGVVRNGFAWDDRELIVENESLSRPDVLIRAFQLPTWQLADPMRPPDAFYRPVGVLSLAVDRWIGGVSPAVYHLHNLLLHVAVVLLLHRLLLRRGAGPLAALAAAAWFATLPASAEAVAWVAVRFDLLGTALALLAVLLHPSARPAARLATPLLVLAATLAKETFYVLPVLLALDDWLERRPGAPGETLRARAARYLPLAAAIAVSLGIRARVVGGQGGALAGRGPEVLLVDALSTVAEMARLAVAPLPLTVTRAYAPLGPGGLALVSAGLLVALVAAWRVRTLRLGLAWFAVGCALPSLVVRPLGFVGERYLYVPAVGLALAGAAACSLLRTGAARRLAGAVVAAAVALQALASSARVRDWRDDRTLFAAALDVDPASWFAMFQLGHAEARDGRWPAAADWYRRALQHNRTDGRLLSNAAAAFDSVGDYPAAVEAGRLAVEASPANPRARYNLALPLARLGRVDQARAELDAALRLAPGYAKARELRDELAALSRRAGAAGP